MACEKENGRTESIPTEVPTGTADPSQKLDEADMTSLNDGIPSGSTSYISSLGNSTSGINETDREPIEEHGFNEMHTHLDANADGSDKGCFQQSVVYASEALPCSPRVSSSDDVESGTTNSSSTAKCGPESFALESPNDLKSTDGNGNLTSKSPKPMSDTKKEMKILKKVPHLQFNFSVVGLPRASNPMGKYSSLANQKRHVLPPTNDRPTGRALNVKPPTNHGPTGRALGVNPPTNHRPIGKALSVNPPTSHRPTGKALSVNPPTSHRPAGKALSVDAPTNHRPTERALSVNPPTNLMPTGKALSVNPPINRISTGEALNVNNRPMSRDKFNWNTECEMSPELTRGPRCHDKNLHVESSTVKEEFGHSICRDKYNLPDFQTKYENAKFYVIKSFNEDDIHKCIKYNVWTSTRYGNEKLNAAFHDAEVKSSESGIKCPVFLFFSVNGSGQFVGVAEMIGPVDFKKDVHFWKLDKYNGFFPIKWHIIKDVPNAQFRYIILQNNDNKRVTHSRDTQEIELKQGMQMLDIFKKYLARTCLLDDYDYYENQEKLFRAQRNIKHTTSQREECSNDNFQMTSKGVEKMKLGSTNQATHASSFVNRRESFSCGKQGL